MGPTAIFIMTHIMSVVFTGGEKNLGPEVFFNFEKSLWKCNVFNDNSDEQCFFKKPLFDNL